VETAGFMAAWAAIMGKCKKGAVERLRLKDVGTGEMMI
jgi:hypothetical protein